MEVARLAEMLANELGLNAELAKKAGLLHDIGKIDAGNGEAHTKVGAEILKKHKMHDCIVNTAEAHHFDTELKYPEARVATAADIISASRPGARFDTKELFIERMGNLENLVTSVKGVQKARIMQAGREIMTFFNPEEIDDAQLEKLTEEIGTKIEDQLDYPGAIRIVGIRENKVVHYLR
jgi:ribonuclease Y